MSSNAKAVTFQDMKIARTVPGATAQPADISVSGQQILVQRSSSAVVLNNLGAALQALDDHQGARVAFERSLRLAEAALGPEHPEVAATLANLGHALHSLGDTTRARTTLRRSLRILRQFMTEDHPVVRAVRASIAALEGRPGGGAPPLGGPQ